MAPNQQELSRCYCRRFHRTATYRNCVIEVLILVRFQGETNNPRPSRDAMQSLRVGCERWQALFKLTNHTGHIVEYPIGKLLLPEFIPDVLLGIEVGGKRRQAHELYITRERDVFGSIRAYPIQDHDDQFPRMRGADLGEQLVHALCVHVLADYPIQFTFPRANRSIDIGELPFIGVGDHRPQRRRGPAAFDSDYAAETGFVLEHQPHAAKLHGVGVEELCQHLREFFSQSSWTFGSACGCRVSGATLRQPWRCNIRYTTVAATGRLRRWA